MGKRISPEQIAMIQHMVDADPRTPALRRRYVGSRAGTALNLKDTFGLSIPGAEDYAYDARSGKVSFVGDYPRAAQMVHLGLLGGGIAGLATAPAAAGASTASAGIPVIPSTAVTTGMAGAAPTLSAATGAAAAAPAAAAGSTAASTAASGFSWANLLKKLAPLAVGAVTGSLAAQPVDDQDVMGSNPQFQELLNMGIEQQKSQKPLREQITRLALAMMPRGYNG